MTIQEHKEKSIAEFRVELKKAYAGILSDDILNQGNKWFEDYIRAKLDSQLALIVGMIEQTPEYIVIGDKGFTDGYSKFRSELLRRLGK